MLDAPEALLTVLGGRFRSVGQARVLRETDHRPWPLPRGSWAMAQSWEDLLFAHWRVDADALRAVVPEQLPIDTHDGSAWLGVTPFEVTGARLRGTLPPPGVGRFCELNVRTYTTLDGRPGIYFFSLDAASALAVLAARRLYRLPYFRARMSIARTGPGRIAYRSARTSSDGPPARLEAAYEPVGEPSPAPGGSLEHFLTERYCLYTLDDRQRVLRADIHHPPWPLQRALASLDVNTMGRQIGLELPREDALLHFAARQDVVIWPLQLASP
ncbi:MAG: DUF2071 domain-containing protein [Actinomycetota bacterium]|nr:DUF2071 domain-containing protein [Actinomycetota bacterium]